MLTKNIISEEIQKLELIDFADLAKVLDWICEFQVTTKGLRISDENRKVILSIFQKNGIDCNITFSSNLTSKDLAFWICSQALRGIVSNGYPSQSIHDLVNILKSKSNLGLVNK